MARLNDTAAIVARPPTGNQHHSVSVRRIENGFITEVCESNPDTGAYRSSTTFSSEPPMIKPAQVSEGGGHPDKQGDLRETVQYLRGTTLGAEKAR